MVASIVRTITEAHFHQHYNINVLRVILASQEAAKQFGPDGGSNSAPPAALPNYR